MYFQDYGFATTSLLPPHNLSILSRYHKCFNFFCSFWTHTMLHMIWNEERWWLNKMKTIQWIFPFLFVITTIFFSSMSKCVSIVVEHTIFGRDFDLISLVDIVRDNVNDGKHRKLGQDFTSSIFVNATNSQLKRRKTTTTNDILVKYLLYNAPPTASIINDHLNSHIGLKTCN